MDTVAVQSSSPDRLSPYLAAVPFAIAIFSFYGTLLPFGLLGIAGFAGAGLLWVWLVGLIAQWLMRRGTWHAWLANATLVVSIIAIGLLTGAGAMYIFMMHAVVQEPSTTYAALSALMQPAVPYFIAINSLLELLIMLLVVFFNWDAGDKRRTLTLIGVGLYLVMRVWTYLVYAETRLDISTHTLSAADVEWFTRTLATDYRPVLVLITQAFFIFAALVPLRPMTDRARRRAD